MKPVDNVALRNARKDGSDWLTYGHDYAETHYSPLKQIDARNVNRLGLAWSFQTNSEPGPLEATPIVANGMMYFTVTWDGLYAVDAHTGDLKWKWIPKIGHHNFPPGSQNDPNRVRTGPSLCCGPVNRGVAIYDGKIYLGTLDARLIAFDAETGKIVWEVRTAPRNSDYSITGAPRVVKGMVIIGNGGGEYGVRGYVSAYDANSGKQIWRTYTVPGDPSKPFEDPFLKRAAKTWNGKWWKLGGGGLVWNAISYDPRLNLVYVGTGQGSPWAQQYRSPGGGANEWICSIIALDADTGKYVWAFQTTPGGRWDYDADQDMILADLKIHGEQRQVIMQAPKNGIFYVLDRKTGRFISGAPYTKVTWTTGLDPKTGKPTVNPQALYGTSGALVWPSDDGGHEWEAMSFNPNTGLAYIPEIDSGFRFVEARDFKPELGRINWGITLRPPVAKPGAKPLPQPSRATGSLEAWDPVSESARWKVPGMYGGGTMTTAGNLVFAASKNGDFAAFAADSGRQLWTVKLPPGIAGPVTYSLHGRQYVSVLAGRSGNGRLYTFALGAEKPVPSSGPPPPGLVATAAGGASLAVQVHALHQFRDHYLESNGPGRAFLHLYYRVSPPIAEIVARHRKVRLVAREFLLIAAWPVQHPSVSLGLLLMLMLVVFAYFRLRSRGKTGKSGRPGAPGDMLR